MPRIEEIALPDTIAADYKAEPPFNSLRGIGRLNAFVGPNNSGKSRLLRELFLAGKDLMISTDDNDARIVRQCVRDAKRDALQLTRHRALIEKVDEALDGKFVAFHPCGQFHFDRSDLASKIKEAASRFDPHHLSHMTADEQTACSSIRSALSKICRGLPQLYEKHKPQGSPPRPLVAQLHAAQFVYIPMLRGMRLCSDNPDLKHAYFDRTWLDYVKGRKDKGHAGEPNIEQARRRLSGKTIVTGLDLYDTLTDRLLGTLADRKFIGDFEKYLSKTFFRGTPIALIPRRDGDTVHIKIGSEKERPVQSLGDGLQQLIILTLPLFEHRDKPLFLFIEEPDLFLHPGYQRVLIDTIVEDRNRDLYVFVTTHSNQFLDITLNEEACSIFRCKKQPTDDDGEEHDPKFSVTNASLGDNELLKHIGVRPSSVLFANCTIWVEGITDRLYFARYLDLMLKEQGLNFTENLHYAFVEYGGGNITHWSFLDDEGMNVERICSRLFLISDQDAGKDARHQKLADVLGERFYRLKVKEVENLLTPKIVAAVIEDYEGPDFEINKFEQTAYAGRYLGRFIDDVVLPDKSKSKRYGKRETCYEDASGTVKDKVVFCRKALKHIQSVDDLSDEAKLIAKKLSEFVAGEND